MNCKLVEAQLDIAQMTFHTWKQFRSQNKNQILFTLVFFRIVTLIAIKIRRRKESF